MRKCQTVCAFLCLFILLQILFLISFSNMKSPNCTATAPKWEQKPMFSDLPAVFGLRNVSYCSNVTATNIIVVIPSAADNISRRQFIRKTWAKSNTFSRVLFFVAKSSSLNTTLHLIEESSRYMDILLIDTPDSYHSVTLRLLAIFKWIYQNCSNGFIMKVDDDIIIHPQNYVLSGLVDQLIKDQNEELVYGRIFHGAKPHRSGKYEVTREEWPFQMWPDFVVGFCYVMTQPALAAIMEAYQKSDYYVWLEDVYITGILLEKGGGMVRQKNVFEYETEKEGGYVMDVDSVDRVVRQSRKIVGKKMSNEVDMISVRDKLADKTFVHLQAFSGIHEKGEEKVRDWIWEDVWEMEGSMLNTSTVDFCIVKCYNKVNVLTKF